MNSKEIVASTIEFRNPKRLSYSVDIDVSYYESVNAETALVLRKLLKNAPEDICRVWDDSIDYLGQEEYVDRWGVKWKQAKAEGHPLEAGWQLLDELRIPEPYPPGWREAAIEKKWASRDKYVLGHVWFTLFERLWFLRGFENMLLDPYLYEDRFVFLRDKILDYNLRKIRVLLELGVDGIFFSDDWGDQQSLLMNPKDWRKYYKPCYKEMFDCVHMGGAHVWLHSCGNVLDIVPDLIEIGVNVLNPIQPQAMDVHALGRRFGGKLCFYGGADVQGTLPRGTAQDVEREVDCLVQALSRNGAGYIGGTSHTILPDTPIENIEALFRAFNRYADPDQHLMA